MIPRAKFKQLWNTKPDNSQLIAPITQVQLYRISQFVTRDWETYFLAFENLINKFAKEKKFNDKIYVIQDAEDLQNSVIYLSSLEYVTVRIWTQYRKSYKGFISWMLIGNLQFCILVDCISLRNHLSNLLKIFQNQKITKFVFDWRQTYRSLKRDFSIFPINMFDLYILQTEYQTFAQQGRQLRQKTFRVIDQNTQLFVARPIEQKLLHIIQQTHELMCNNLLKLPYNQYSRSINSDQYIENLYKHYQQINQVQVLGQVYVHQPVHSLTNQQIENLTPKMQKLYFQLIKFREHVGKMHDVSVEAILPKSVIQKILQNNKISVLEISEMYNYYNCLNIGGLEICKRIYDVIQLNEQLAEQSDKLKSQILYQQFNSSKKQQNESINIKKILKDIQWGDSSEWLNRRDDPSIKLYKQIISIDEFDYSVGEQYISMMKGKGLKKSQISKFLKYAQYMRNRNYEKLQSLYKMSLIVKESQKQDQFSEQNQLQKQQIKQNKQKRFKNQAQRGAKSSTSLDDRVTRSNQQKCSTNIRSQKGKVQSLSQIQNLQEQASDKSRSRKSSESSSLKYLQMDNILISRSDISELPATIQEIYELAQQIKQNTDKKANKKKEKKGKGEIKKQIQFVPTFQDIQNLINTITSDTAINANKK